MERKRARQKQIPGTEDPDVPANVIAKGQDYADTLHERMSLQQRENTLKEELEFMAEEHGLKVLDVGDDILTFERDTKVKVKCKRKKADE